MTPLGELNNVKWNYYKNSILFIHPYDKGKPEGRCDDPTSYSVRNSIR